jgi:hypothetical protein
MPCSAAVERIEPEEEMHEHRTIEQACGNWVPPDELEPAQTRLHGVERSEPQGVVGEMGEDE